MNEHAISPSRTSISWMDLTLPLELNCATACALTTRMSPLVSRAIVLQPPAAVAIRRLGVANTVFGVSKQRRSQVRRKFLAGAFFVSAGIQFYLYLANVSVPILGTNLVFTPKIIGLRSIPHFIFFLLCLYFGFIAKRKGPRSSAQFNSR